jgi:capsular exopolysaccharide synthesis family protein
VELKRYLGMLGRWWWLIVVSVLIGLGLAYLINLNSTTIYQSSTKLMVNQPASTGLVVDYNTLLANEQLAKIYVQILVSRPVLQKVIDNLQLKTNVETLTKSVSSGLVRDTQIISLSVEDTSAERAAAVANEIVKQVRLQNQTLQTNYYAFTKQALQAQITTLQTELNRIQTALSAITEDTEPAKAERSRLTELLTDTRSQFLTASKNLEDLQRVEAQASNNLYVIESAEPPREPVRPRQLLNLLLGFGASLIIGVGLVFLFSYLDTRVRAEDAEHLTGLPVLGWIQRIKGKNDRDKFIRVNQPDSPVTEAYRLLQANLEFIIEEASPLAILVTSVGPAEGKTTTLANLAVNLAESGKKVIVVDTDLRKPTLHTFFALSNERGLTNALQNRNHDIEDYLMATGVQNLWLLPGGPLPYNPIETLGSKRMAGLIEELKIEADIVLFDSPATLVVADASFLARKCDLALLVIRPESTRREPLKKTCHQLQQSGIKLAGLVLNRVSPRRSLFYQYYFLTSNRYKRSERLRQSHSFSHHATTLLSAQSDENLIEAAADSSVEPEEFEVEPKATTQSE